MQQFHERSVKQEQIVIRGCPFEPKERGEEKKLKKSKFLRMHMKKLWLINSKKYDMDLLRGV